MRIIYNEIMIYCDINIMTACGSSRSYNDDLIMIAYLVEIVK